MQLFDDEFKYEMRKLLYEETADIRQDVATIKNMLGTHGMQLKTMHSDINSLKNTARTQSYETNRLGILLEDLNERFAAARELRWD